ncbi:Hypothetical predicted protein [Paramuricea clavata]|uniref:Uncharacterized protein n=1 Tax=Paramuricea clavata TaxID=317549 RepID=A0A7D9I553_PARCT|nr:Hypothetical predicted protein [Paramuricea clavata]
MSEELNIHDYLKFKSTLTFSSESCLSYIRKQNSNKVLEEEKKELQEQLETLEARCDSLLQEVAELRQTTQRAADLEQSYSEISNQNDKLKEYVDSLVDRDLCKHCDSNYRNNGRTYNELDKLFLSDCQTGEKVTLQYNNEKKSAYQFLSEEDKDKVRNVVYIMDKFCISDAAYHEFSMTNNDGLPRSYLIKQCRQDLNKVYSISRTPGEWPGAQLSFKDKFNHQLSKKMEKLGDKMLTTQRVKISGDGAKMSRISNFVVPSFSLLSEGEKVMSTKGIHTVAILNGKEDYGVLQTAGKNLFKEINDLIATREINVDGKKINLEFYLGGDYKDGLALTQYCVRIFFTMFQRIGYLPVIDASATEFSTIHAILKRCTGIADKLQLRFATLVFDEAIYSKVQQIRLRNDLDRTKSETHKKSVNEAKSTISNMTNPFIGEQIGLVNISNGMEVDAFTADGILNAEELGEYQFSEFCQKNLFTDDPDIFNSIKKNKLKTFSSDNIKIKNCKGQLIALKTDRNLFAWLLVMSKSQELDLKELLSYSLSDYPLSLAMVTGGLVKTAKSKMFEILKSMVEDPVVNFESIGERNALIVDAFVILHAMKGSWKTISDFADATFALLMKLARQSKAVRLDFVEDRYPVISIKNAERSRRAAQGVQRVPEQKSECSKAVENVHELWREQRIVSEYECTYETSKLNNLECMYITSKDNAIY